MIKTLGCLITLNFVKIQIPYWRQRLCHSPSFAYIKSLRISLRDIKNKWKGYPSDPLKGCASDQKKDVLVIHQKDELVIQVNFWWVDNLQRNFNLWKESKSTSKEFIFMLWFCLFIYLAYMFNFVSNYIACCLIKNIFLKRIIKTKIF